MVLHDDYRARVVEQRREAETANLPLVRLQHLRAAAKWESLAAEIEKILVGRRG